MSVQVNFPFTTSGNYTFDSAKIEVSGGKAQLIESTGPNTYTQDFSSGTGFTLDAAKSEVTGGQFQQIDQVPTNGILGANYDTDQDANWFPTGSVTATENGTATSITGNKLDCTGDMDRGIYYVTADTATGAIRFRYTPDYTNSPSSNINMVMIYNGSNDNDRLGITNSPSGNNIRLWVYDSTGTGLEVATTIGGSWTPTSGTEYEFELNWDSTTGFVYLFIDGVLHGTTNVGIWTRGTSASRLYIGASTVVYNQSDALFNDVILFDAVQHTTGYTPGYSVADARYLADTVTMPSFNYSGSGTFISITSFTSTEANAPLWVINEGGSAQYWNGSAWVASDLSPAQANTAADMNTNLPSLDVEGETVITFKIITQNGASQMSVSNLVMGTTEGIPFPTDNPTIKPTTILNANGLEAFSATTNASGSDDVRFALLVDTVEKYWDGAAWSNSSGYAQSNTAAEINTNASELTIASSLQPLVYPHSDDGSTTPYIDDMTLCYNFEAPPVDITTLNVFGYLLNADGTPDLNAKVEIEPEFDAVVTSKNAQIQLQKITVTPDSDGGWQANLVKSDEINDIKYVFRFISGNLRTTTETKTVVGTGQVEYEDLT